MLLGPAERATAAAASVGRAAIPATVMNSTGVGRVTAVWRPPVFVSELPVSTRIAPGIPPLNRERFVMPISDTNRSRAVLASRYIQEYLEATGETTAKPGDLMPYLIEKGVFTSDNRNGQPLRALLRTLVKAGQLDLIPQATYEQPNVNKIWHLDPVRKSS